jgi:iron complex transport system substrate-binding protein
MLSSGIANSVNILDNQQTKLNNKITAQRIVSLAPNLTEILFAIGAGKQIVGVSSYSNYPKAAQNIPVVATASQIDLEKIVALKPDLIVAWRGGNPLQELQKIQQLHIPIFYSDSNKLNDLPRLFIQLGVLTGHAKQAANLAATFKNEITSLIHHYKDQTPVNVFYEVWQNPLFTVGQDSIINQAIVLCGGRNIFARTLSKAPEVNLESILAANPQVIIGGYTNDQWQNYWRPWLQVQAVKKQLLFSINPDLLQRNGPRLTEGITKLCQVIAIARRQYAR